MLVIDLSHETQYVLFCQIFNSKLVLASPETATDADYAAILGVIGHEVNCHHTAFVIVAFISILACTNLCPFLITVIIVLPQLDW